MHLKDLLRKVLQMASALVSLLRYTVCSEHPRRAAIAASYVCLFLRMALFRRPPQSILLLGTRIHFTNARAFRYVFRELFIEEVYGGCEQTPATIVDCGSNIGMSILAFKNSWPQSTILGIEASPETYAVLVENVKDLAGVTVVNKVISDRHGTVPFYTGPNPLLGSTNMRRAGGKESLVEGAPLSDFITGPVDLLKVDIEGSELVAFAELEASGKMPLIRQMFIEYHHHLPGETCRLSIFLDRLERCGFDYDLGAPMPERPGDCQNVMIRATRME